jgi:4-hydroxybenzoate polyprenyltransferase
MFTRIKAFLNLIKFEHTVFALPFAYLGMLLAANGWPGWGKFIWITIAMAGARTVAMGFNRIADRFWDARNPRTTQRPLVTGSISLRTAWMGTLAAVLILLLAAWQLGTLALQLAPVALLFLFGYSFTKRFTDLSHFILGMTDGMAPVGAWVAVRSSLFTPADVPAWLLLGIVTLWIGGFDLIYACQDVEFDRQYGLHSIAANAGVAYALNLSSICHGVMMVLLAGLGGLMGLGWPYWVSLVLVAALIVYEHRLVSPSDLSKVNVAFFNVNSYISLLLFAGVLVNIFIFQL